MGIIPTKDADLEDALQLGMDWSLREGAINAAVMIRKACDLHLGSRY